MLKKNLLYQIAYQVLTIILPFITSPYLSRIIGAEGIGEYSYSYSIAHYFSLFIMLGISNHGARAIAACKGNKRNISITFFSIYFFQLLMGIVVCLLYIIGIVYFRGRNLIALTQTIYVISVVIDVNWLFFGLEKFKLTVTRNFLIKIVTVLCIFVFVRNEADLIKYALIMAGSALASQLVIWPFVFKEVNWVRISEIDLKSHIGPIAILFVPVLAASLYKYMDKIMLGYMCDKRQLGYYENTEKIMSIPTSLITAVGTVMLPRMTNMMANNEGEKAERYIKLSIELSMFIALPLAFGLAGIGKTFAPLFWGIEFMECGTLIQMIAITSVFLAWANVLRTQLLIPQKMDSVFLVATIVGAIINIAINLLCIPLMGARGAVVGTVVAEFTVAFYQTVKCRKILPIGLYLKEIVPFFLSASLMFIVVYSIGHIKLNGYLLLILELVVGILFYASEILIYYLKIKRIGYTSIRRFIYNLKRK